MRPPTNEEIRIIATDPGARPRYYNRKLVGKTVQEAFIALEEIGGKLELPVIILEPYLLNGEQVDPNDLTILKAGDVLTVVDP